VVHIHDELMLKVLCGVENVTINEIIRYNKMLKKNVYVIDIYRSPIEHKMSIFFEKIGNFHFNNTDEKVNEYSVGKVIKRFNNLFPHMNKSDYYKEVYNIPFPEHFDYENKYIKQEINGISYIKLRLMDSNVWSTILTKIFGVNMKIVKDYETDKKPIREIFNKFKNIYKIPGNFMQEIEKCEQLKYYYSPLEREAYLKSWRIKQTGIFTPYTENEYKLYMELSIDNQHIPDIHREHYIDVGCTCAGCSLKRNQIMNKLSRGINVDATIDHNKANDELRNLIHRKNGEKMDKIIKKLALLNANKSKVKNPKNIIKGLFNNQFN